MDQIPRGRFEHVTHSGSNRGVSMVGRLAVAFGMVLLVVELASVTGCNALQKKHDNPVLQAAPRRVRHVQHENETQVAEVPEKNPGEVTPTGASEPDVPVRKPYNPDPWADWKDDTAIYNSQVAATVNGAPILNGDVLDRYSAYLIGLREKMQKDRMPPEKYSEVREAFVQRDLPSHIQRRLLVESMKSSLKPEQIKMLNGHLDGLFEKEVEKLKRELKVSTRTELELELNKKGTTLQNVKDTFVTERMAMEFVAMKMDKAEHIDRLDLLNYYQAHQDEFAVPATVTWEQIQVSFTDSKSKEKALEKIKQARKDLIGGAPFDTVAKKYSDGPTARQGGQWEPMESGTLADKKLEAILFEIPKNQLSAIYEGPTEFQLVQVVDRQEAGRREIGDVQDEIRQKLEQDQNKKRPEKLFKKLMSEAIIETKYDVPTQQKMP